MVKHVLSLQEEKKMVLKAQQNLDYFSELYEYYVPKIYRYIACKTNNPTVFSAFFHVLTIEFPSDTYISET